MFETSTTFIFVEAAHWDQEVHGPVPTQAPVMAVFGGQELRGWFIGTGAEAEPGNTGQAPDFVTGSVGQAP